MSSVETPRLSDFAIIVDPKDNVAVVKNGTHGVIPPGHRFAIRDIRAGEFVLQFGQPIGTSLGIREGEQITHDNMSDDVPTIRELPADLHTPPPDYFP
ncbi:MAG TPA: hypothetical protein VFB70_02475, partial [Pyrinomonadaceae bacterium]|nr:hypothetical protein [Pyrinomonadaceae bacterium]